jgi:hypothetical protein
MAIDRSGNLYVVGDFENFGDVAAADYIAVWNGSAWGAVGTPNTGAASITSIQSVATDSEDNVYVGGPFTNLGDDADADRFAKWDGSSWADVGGAFSAAVNAILVWPDDSIYVLGSFTTIDSTSYARVARWNGTAWEALGDGIPDDHGYALARGYDGLLYAGGGFTTALAIWNGASWASPDVDLPGDPTVYALAVGRQDPVVEQNYDLFVGFDGTGTAQSAGTKTVTNGGTEVAYPVIVVKRSGGTTASLVNIRNETNGKQLYFSCALQDGETLTIDLRPGYKSIMSSQYGSRLDAILSNSDFGDWVLQPGDNNVTMLVSESGAPTMTAYMTWRETYASVD